MKKKSIVVLALTSLVLSAFAAAQNRTQPARPGTANTSGFGAAGGRGAHQQPGMPDELDKNISITISGTMAGGLPLNLTMTGCGRIFSSDAILGTTEVAGNKIPNIGSIEYLVRPLGTGYMVTYSIGARVAIATSATKGKDGGAKSTSIGFEEVMVTGTVRCKPGEAIEIFKGGDQAVNLKVVEN